MTHLQASGAYGVRCCLLYRGQMPGPLSLLSILIPNLLKRCGRRIREVLGYWSMTVRWTCTA